jgi:hypothetical protein
VSISRLSLTPKRERSPTVGFLSSSPEYKIAEPSADNIQSFWNPATRKSRFSDADFCGSVAKNNGGDQPGGDDGGAKVTPSASALNDAVMQAEKTQSEQELEDGLPDLRREGAEGWFGRPPRPESSSTSIPRKARYEEEFGDTEEEEEDVETANEDEGLEECVFLWCLFLGDSGQRLTPSEIISVELNEAVLAPYNKGGRTYKPGSHEGDWWPAQVIAYIPPPTRRRRSQPIIKGSYLLRYLDGKEKVFTSREHFCTMHDRNFGKHPVRRPVFPPSHPFSMLSKLFPPVLVRGQMGMFSISGQLAKTQLAAAVREHFDTLERILGGTYPPALERHNQFLKGSRAERKQLKQQVFFGRISQHEVEVITDQLAEWINGKTVRPFFSAAVIELYKTEHVNRHRILHEAWAATSLSNWPKWIDRHIVLTSSYPSYSNSSPSTMMTSLARRATTSRPKRPRTRCS